MIPVPQYSEIKSALLRMLNAEEDMVTITDHYLQNDYDNVAAYLTDYITEKGEQSRFKLVRLLFWSCLHRTSLYKDLIQKYKAQDIVMSDLLGDVDFDKEDEVESCLHAFFDLCVTYKYGEDKHERQLTHISERLCTAVLSKEYNLKYIALP